MHDYKGVERFILNRIGNFLAVSPAVKLKARLDAAFFADKHVQMAGWIGGGVHDI